MGKIEIKKIIFPGKITGRDNHYLTVITKNPVTFFQDLLSSLQCRHVFKDLNHHDPVKPVILLRERRNRYLLDIYTLFKQRFEHFSIGLISCVLYISPDYPLREFSFTNTNLQYRYNIPFEIEEKLLFKFPAKSFFQNAGYNTCFFTRKKIVLSHAVPL